VPAAPPDPDLIFATIAGEAHVALAVSGGSDSMALLRLAHEWACSSPSPRLSILTVDHGLRLAAASEARQVAAWCEALGLSHHIFTWDGPRPLTGIQASARKIRYVLMTDWCQANGASLLLTAHTRDDQAETVLMRLMRTASIDSIAGIPRHGQWNGTRLFRPLLDHGREVLRDHLRKSGQAWIDDPSNDDPQFERVRLRAILPPLAETGITSERLAGLAADCSAVASELQRRAAAWINADADERDGYCSLPREGFLALPPELRIRVLARVIGHYGGGGSAERDELLRLLEAMAASASRWTLGGAVIWARRDRFLIGREAARIATAPVIVPQAGEVLWDRRYRVSAPAGTVVLPALRVPGFRSSSSAPAIFRQAEPAILRPNGTIAAFRACFLDMKSL
jgi:tRNA(Ile)-lysidine synthase